MKIRLIIYIVSTAGIIYYGNLMIDSSAIFYVLPYLFLYLVLGISIIYSLFSAIRNKKNLEPRNRFTSLIIGLICLLTAMITNKLAKPDRNKAIYISAGNYTDLTGVHLTLWSDNTFTLVNSGPFGGSYYRGNYQMQNDILKLDTGDLRLYPSLTFKLGVDTISNKKYFAMIPDTSKAAEFYKLLINEKK